MSFVANDQVGTGRARRPLRVAPAWVGAARPAAGTPIVDSGLLPVREAVWIWSVRRYARIALWALPLGAVLYGWSTLGVPTPPGALVVTLAAAWLSTVAMVALAGLLAGARTRRPAVAGLLIGLAGTVLVMSLAALPPGTAPDGSPLAAAQTHLVAMVAAGVTGTGWLLLGWAVFRSGLVNPADGVLLMIAAVTIGAGTFAVKPLPTVGALLLLAAGMGIAWTGGRLIPRA
jgi:Amt family ammonium transporter